MSAWLLWAFALGLAGFVQPSRGATPEIQIDEVLAGANGDSRIQFIELRFCCVEAASLGPANGDAVGRARLVFMDAAGAQTGAFVFPDDAPIGVPDATGGYSVLIGTAAFANQGQAPALDFVMPPGVVAQAGQVCLTGNPTSSLPFPIHACLSYGGFAGLVVIDGAGVSNGPPGDGLPILGALGLQRVTNLGVYEAGQVNSDFALSLIAPRNSAGATGSIDVLPIAQQGRTLFEHETFLGNGRTCSTCHRPDDHFQLSPSMIASLPANDPLFVAEQVTELEELENPCLMRGPRALILENIDGFDQPPFFRGSPHLLNIGLTAPYGQSSETPDLQTFATTAVRQHLPRTLNRNENPSSGPVDFRVPTQAELLALETFMHTITMPSDGDYDLDRMLCAAVNAGANRAAVDRGKALFFGTAKCSKCHSGPLLNEADALLGGGAQSFNTGVFDMPINDFDACIGGALQYPDSATRQMATPSLIGVKHTAPYFHDHAAATLREAVQQYNSPEFNDSPGGQLVGGILLLPSHVNDLLAFLGALTEPTACIDDDVAPNIACPGAVQVGTDQGVCTATVTPTAPTASDACCVQSLQRAGGQTGAVTLGLGLTNVSWTAADYADNEAQCAQSITVVDDEAPVLNCPSNVSVVAALGATEAFVEVPTPSATDNCALTEVVNDWTDGADGSAVYPLGVTQVQWTARDAAGNTATCNHLVTVSDPLGCEGGPGNCAGRPFVVASEPLSPAVAADQCEVATVSVIFSEDVRAPGGGPLHAGLVQVDGGSAAVTEFSYESATHRLHIGFAPISSIGWHAVRLHGSMEDAQGEPLNGNTTGAEPGADHHWIDIGLLPADFDGNFRVAAPDRADFLVCWNGEYGVSGSACDHQCDGDVDVFDRIQFLRDWSLRLGTNIGPPPGH